jgi:hypothetical protein
MVFVVVVADVSRGTALIPVPTTMIPVPTTMMPVATAMMAIDAPMMPLRQRESAGWPRRVRPLRRRGPVSSARSYRFAPSRGPSRRCADMSISFGAVETTFA